MLVYIKFEFKKVEKVLIFDPRKLQNSGEIRIPEDVE
jgi:hypothetical protein